MEKSKDKTEKIIESGYSFSENDSNNNTRIIKRWAVLGGFFFILNICFILFICVHSKLQGPKDAVVMVEGAEAEAQSVNDKSEADSNKELTDKGDGQTDKSGKNEQADKETGKRVYLTFDDGPSNNTEEILDILSKHHVKATFFVIGKDDDYSKKLYKRIVEEGHTLGMHSYSHDYSKIYTDKKAFFKDYDKLEKLLNDVTGVTPAYYRFPGGTSNTISKVPMKTLIKEMNKRGTVYFDWNAMSGDANGKDLTKRQMINNVLKDVEIHNTSVVLMHDAGNKDKTVAMLPALLNKLKKLKVSILPIDENTPLVQHVKADTK